jgi:hypothetical protein
MIVQKQPENVEYLNCPGGLITTDARRMCEIKSRIAVVIAAFNKKKTFQKQIELRFKEETNEVLHLERSFLCC